MKWFLLILFLIFAGLGCATKKVAQDKPAKPVDPWHGKYVHETGKYELVFEHFAPEYVTADITDTANNQKTLSIFVTISGRMAIHKDRTDPDCRLEFKVYSDGVLYNDFCHNMTDDIGFYYRSENK